jgi:hypothetical protein
MRGRPWTFDEVVRMFELIEQRRTSIEIGKILGRNRRCIGRRAIDYGLSLDYRHLDPPKPAPKPDEPNPLGFPMTLKKIIETTAERHGLQVSEVQSSCRRRKFVKCRQEIAVKARESGYSYPRIGRALNRDHTSIMHLVRTNSSTHSTGPKVADQNPSDAYTARWNTARTAAAR